MSFNFQTICSNYLLKDLPLRNREVISRRFGLSGKRQTLEAIGKTHDITRERVRQVEEDSFKKLIKNAQSPQCQKVFLSIAKELKKTGNVRREDILLNQVGGKKFKNHVLFLLTLAEPFQRAKETQDFHAFWFADKNSLSLARKQVNSFISELKRKKKPLPAKIPVFCIEISKNILKGPEGLYGLSNWPEINPRGVKDKAYLILKRKQKPLHFTAVASLINSSSLFNSNKKTIPQTVHNELIKDSRFVLVGRGLYALKEWGYQPGVVRQVLAGVLKNSKKALNKEQIVKEVLKQRQVKANTILLNLQNRKYFLKSSEDRYTVRKA